MTITINAIWIPIIITVVLFGYSIFIHEEEGGYISTGNLIPITVSLIISMFSWMIWGILT